MTAVLEDSAGRVVATLPDGSSTVHQRMIAILAELPAIGKDSRNEQQGFMFRSHDAVLNALNPLMAKWGVFVVPNVLERVTDKRATARGGTMYEVNLHVQFTFYGPDGDSIVASAWGEGTDSGDKSTNKAMTMAFKNVLAQAFAVSTAETIDTDARTDEMTFDPARTYLPGAPRGWDKVATLLEHVDKDVDWKATTASAVKALHGAESVGALPAELQATAGVRLANVAARLAEGGDFPPPTDEQIVAAYAEMWEGVRVEVVRRAPEPSAEEREGEEATPGEAPLGSGPEPDIDENIGFGPSDEG